MATLRCALLLFGLPFCAVGQPFTVDSRPYAPDTTEAKLREATGYSGFIFDFNKATSSDVTPNGRIQPNKVADNPFLGTLPSSGNGQNLVTLGPCGSNTPHTHPRGSEISFLLYGNIAFGMVEENSVRNTLIIRNMTQYSTIHIPQGLLHFSYNDHCEWAAFLSNFGESDPGTQTMWAAMMQIPTPILHAATGIPEDKIEGLKLYPLVTAPGTGGEDCLKRCGLDFGKANALTPIWQLPPPNDGAR